MEAQLIASDLDLTSALRIGRAIFTEAGICDVLDFFPDGPLRCPSVACVCLDIVIVGLRCLVEISEKSQVAENVMWADQTISSARKSLIALARVLAGFTICDPWTVPSVPLELHEEQFLLNRGDWDNSPDYTFQRFEVSILNRKLKETIEYLPVRSPAYGRAKHRTHTVRVGVGIVLTGKVSVTERVVCGLGRRESH